MQRTLQVTLDMEHLGVTLAPLQLISTKFLCEMTCHLNELREMAAISTPDYHCYVNLTIITGTWLRKLLRASRTTAGRT